MNGWYNISTAENVNPFWQGEYANVHFTFVPDNQQAFVGKEVYLLGSFTNGLSTEAKLNFNDDDGVYQTSLFLKQGFYSYTYVTKDAKDKNRYPMLLKRMGIFGKPKMIIPFSCISVH